MGMQLTVTCWYGDLAWRCVCNGKHHEVTESECPSAAVQFCTYAPYLWWCIFWDLSFSKLFGFQSNAYLYSKPATGTNNTMIITLVSPRHWRILLPDASFYKGFALLQSQKQIHGKPNCPASLITWRYFLAPLMGAKVIAYKQHNLRLQRMGRITPRPKDLVTSNWGLRIRPKEFHKNSGFDLMELYKEYIICPGEYVKWLLWCWAYFCKKAGDGVKLFTTHRGTFCRGTIH